MAGIETHKIIWLDKFIGNNQEAQALHQNVTAAVDPTARFNPRTDERVQTVQGNVGPFIFVDSIQEAIREIQRNQGKRVIFISSGSFGQDIIPQIAPVYDYVYRIYIFCALAANHQGLQLQYLDRLLIFIHETTLLVRLMRDLSLEFIHQGEANENLNHLNDALRYYEAAKHLQKNANKYTYKEEQMSSVLLRLEGPTGLIERVNKRMQN